MDRDGGCTLVEEDNVGALHLASNLVITPTLSTWILFSTSFGSVLQGRNLRWDHRLQRQNLFMAFKRVPL